MTTRTFGQDIQPVTHQPTDIFPSVSTRIRAVLEDMGPHGRRYALAGIGAACALGLGVAAALLVQLPPEMRDPTPAQGQTVALTELPYQTQALANALNNPPAVNVRDAQSADLAIAPDPAVETTTADLDEKPTGSVSPTSTADNSEPAASQATTPAAAKSTPKDDEADAGAIAN